MLKADTGHVDFLIRTISWSDYNKKMDYIFIAVHILLGWLWLGLFRATRTIAGWEERLNFENTLYTAAWIRPYNHIHLQSFELRR
jgi:hypothetical protein